MAYTLKEFLVEMERRRSTMVGDCNKCKRPVNELDAHTDSRTLRHKQCFKEMVEDSYWNALSDVIDQHPIGLPFIRR